MTLKNEFKMYRRKEENKEDIEERILKCEKVIIIKDRQQRSNIQITAVSIGEKSKHWNRTNTKIYN